jgi:hypothetical protein
VTFRTAGSAFDTVLAVYRGSGLRALTLVGSNDDVSRQDLSSRVEFVAEAGTTYRIAVDGYGGASGAVTLGYSQVAISVPNDLFGSASVCTGETFTVTGSNRGATKEPGEPDHAWVRGGRSVWWTWTAPANGRLTLRTAGSNFDTALAVYTGSAVNALSYVTANNDVGGMDRTSRVELTVRAGTSYRIAVDGYGAAEGNIQLAGSLQRAVELPAPTGLAGTQNARRQVSFSWGRVSGATGYEATVTLNGRAYGNFTTASPGFQISQSMQAGSLLTLRVRAMGANNAPGVWSSTITYRVR